MSRHRNVRNLTHDDYYDYDDDDYYDEDDYYEGEEHQQYSYSHQKQQQQQQEHYTPSAQQQHQPLCTSVAAAFQPKAPPSSTAAAAAVVIKPPPGWGKPGAASSAKSPSVTAPPGWGKPATQQKQMGVSFSTAPPSAGSGGVASPPPGWGKPGGGSVPSKSVAASGSTSVSPNPTGGGGTKTKSGKASTSNSESKFPPTTANYQPKKLPEILKKQQTGEKEQQSQLSMVVLGHVDAGKSTLMGQLLVKVGQVSKRDATKATNLSWLLDENESERARGVTMEIATKGFKTAKHDFVLLDAPGHADFIPIMITGAASADCAILVVASVTGEFEAGFDRGGQTKEHVLLARGLGVSQVIVAINKLDVEGWSQSRYEEIQSKVKEYLIQQQFNPKRTRFVPLSGLTGENVQKCTDPKLQSWYKGPTLLEAINDFQPANRHLEKPLRFIVTDVFAEGKGVTTRGRVVQGFLQIGERLIVMPIGDTVTVNKIEHLQPPSDSDPRRLAIAMAGDTVELVLQGIDIMRVSVGAILSHPDSRPHIAKRFQAKILVMDQLAVPIIKGAQILFHMHSLDVPAVMNKLIAITKRDGTVKKERPRALPGGSSAIVELTMTDRLVLEPFADCRALGRFVLRRGGDTIAVGVIDKLIA